MLYSVSFFLLIASSLLAQYNQTNLPEVRINNHSASLQQGLYSDYYLTRSVYDDMRWVKANDSGIIEFWDSYGSSILETLERLGGIPWQEDAFDIYLIRWYPSVGEGDPLIIPIGGMRGSDLTEKAPSGGSMQFNIILQLAKRLLSQADRSEKFEYRSLADNVLMRPGAYRRDNLALLLTMVTAQEIIGLDSTYSAYKSHFWKKRFAGREVFEKYLLSDWILTPGHTLADWVSEEPRNSSLIRASRPPKRQRKSTPRRPKYYVDGLPLKGQLGIAVQPNSSNRLRIKAIDPLRAAFANGLREDDIILTVNEHRVRTHKQLIERIFETFNEGGATLLVMRGDETFSLPIRPIQESIYDDPYFWEELEDSLLNPEFPDEYPEEYPETDSLEN